MNAGGGAGVRQDRLLRQALAELSPVDRRDLSEPAHAIQPARYCTRCRGRLRMSNPGPLCSLCDRRRAREEFLLREREAKQMSRADEAAPRKFALRSRHALPGPQALSQHQVKAAQAASGAVRRKQTLPEPAPKAKAPGCLLGCGCPAHNGPCGRPRALQGVRPPGDVAVDRLIGCWLAGVRLKRTLSQQELAMGLGLKDGQAEVSSLERGHRSLTVVRLLRVSKLFDAQPAELLRQIEAEVRQVLAAEVEGKEEGSHGA